MRPEHEDGHDTPAPEPKWRRYLRFLRPNPVADLDDELRDHLESTIEQLIVRGYSPDDAGAEAHRRFGDVSRVRREVTQLDAKHQTRVNRLAALETFLYDLRHAARALRRSPAFTIVAATSIALGVAANATIFSIVNAVLLRPIPGTHATGLVRVYANHHSPFQWDEVRWFREHAPSFDYIVGERYVAAGFRGKPGAESERVHVSYVTRGYFPALGVRLALGHGFDVDETQDASSSPVAMLSHAYWQRRFAGDSSVIGSTVLVGEHPLTIVGVTAPEFRSSVMTWVPDMFLPLASAPVITGQPLSSFGGSFYTTARLRRGVGMDAAQAELRGVMAQLAKTDSVRYANLTVRLDHTRGVNAEERAGVAAGSAFLSVMVAMVLLIACANVANLLMGRAAARRTELGVRLAIGASRERVVRQLLTESLLLAAMGTVVGFAAAWFITRVLPATLPAEAGIDSTYFEPDGTVVAFTAMLCLVTTLLFGLVPALRATTPNLVGLLKGDDRGTGRRRRRGTLIVLQAALCVVMLAVASLFLRSLASSRSVDPGFRATGVIDVTVNLDLLGPGIDRATMFNAILRDASALPAVRSATLAAVVPLSGSNMETHITPEAMVAGNRRDAPSVYFNVVGPRYFRTLETPLIRGREFVESDDNSSRPVAVVNETAARRIWPAGDALGKRFHWGDQDGKLFEIVGIARDANYVMPGEAPKATVYLPVGQDERGEMTLMLRTSADLSTMRRSVWTMLHADTPTLPPPPVVHMTDDMAITLLPVRAGAALLGAFGGLALILAAAGIYGVASYSVASRTREIGIRAALGATRVGLVRMVLWESGRRVALGAAIGLVVAVGIAAALSRLLYGVEAVDPVVLVSVAATIAVVAVAAAAGPAGRATKVDPASALRAN